MKTQLAVVRAHSALLIIGFCMEAVYLLYFVGQFPLIRYYRHNLDMGNITGHSRVGLILFVLMFAMLFSLFALGWREVANAEAGNALPLLFGIGSVFALTLLFVYPMTAIDVFAYVAYSKVLLVHHHNPILTPPAAFPKDPIMSRADGWVALGAPYAPFGILVLAVPMLLAGSNFLLNVLLLKLLFSLALLASGFVVYRILQGVEPRAAMVGAFLILWNPYLLFETSANGHIDIVMALFLLCALWSVVEGDLVTGLVLSTVSALIKYVTLLFIPLFAVHGLFASRQRGRLAWYVGVGLVASLAVTVLSYLPFWGGPDTVLWVVRFQSQRYVYSFAKVLSTVSNGAIPIDAASTVGKVLFVPVFVYALFQARKGARELMRACFLALFLYIVLANSGFLYWYSVTLVALAAAVPDFAYRFVAFLMAAAIEIVTVSLNIYVWVWVGVNETTWHPINDISYLVMFVMPLAVLLVLLWKPQLLARFRSPLSVGAEPTMSG